MSYIKRKLESCRKPSCDSPFCILKLSIDLFESKFPIFSKIKFFKKMKMDAMGKTTTWKLNICSLKWYITLEDIVFVPASVFHQRENPIDWGTAIAWPPRFDIAASQLPLASLRSSNYRGSFFKDSESQFRNNKLLLLNNLRILSRTIDSVKGSIFSQKLGCADIWTLTVDSKALSTVVLVLGSQLRKLSHYR